MTRYVGIDIGTTRTKALVYDAASRRVLHAASLATPVERRADGDERRPDDVVEATAGLTRDVLEAVGGGDIGGICVASVGEEVVLVDADGAAVGTTPTWYSVDPAVVDESPRHPEASWFKLAALARRSPALVASATSFTDLSGYVAARLIGASGGALRMDRSHASRTGFYDANDREWDVDRYAEVPGIGSLRLPELVDSGREVGVTAGDVAEAHGLRAGVPVVAGGHDHFCGAFGAGVRETGDVFISVGTSESQLVLVDRVPDVWHDRALDVGTFVDGRHAYVHVARPSGADFADAVAASGAGDDLDALYDALAHLDHQGDPLPDGVAADLRPVLDVLRSQAHKAADITRRLIQTSGTTARYVLVGGAPVAQPLWRRIRSRISPLPLTYLIESELAALGAALLAQSAVEGEAPGPDRTTHPDDPSDPIGVPTS
jgi:xylulokinase